MVDTFIHSDIQKGNIVSTADNQLQKNYNSNSISVVSAKEQSVLNQT